MVNNYLPEKVIELLEKRISDKDEVIETLKAKIVLLKNENNHLLEQIAKFQNK